VDPPHQPVLDGRAEDPANHQRQNAREQHVAGEALLAGKQRGDKNQAGRIDIGEPVQTAEQASEPTGQGIDEDEELPLERGRVSGVECSERHHDARDE
jgi:hypothetical protein